MPRARDLGIQLTGQPGVWNAITDVIGVEVGFTTLIEGDGPLRVGAGPVRTGVTAVLPRGRENNDPVFAGWSVLNGNGELTGAAWIRESGFLEGPILITNTHSVGVVRDAVVGWQARTGRMLQPWSLPVVTETYDGYLNDINGFHIRGEHAVRAIETAVTGRVAEGNVGGGTGMICFEFKGGTGTASRLVEGKSGSYRVGVLVQANFGRRDQLIAAGVPAGREIPEDAPFTGQPASAPGPSPAEAGSIICVAATDAPLLPHQLERLARRCGLGVARTGGTAANSSGDIFLAFSTANPSAARPKDRLAHLKMLPNESLSSLFSAAVEAVEESILNALCAAETMTGADGRRVIGLPHDRLQEVLKKYGRLKREG